VQLPEQVVVVVAVKVWDKKVVTAVSMVEVVETFGLLAQVRQASVHKVSSLSHIHLRFSVELRLMHGSFNLGVCNADTE
jgi:hypothetical protein